MVFEVLLASLEIDDATRIGLTILADLSESDFEQLRAAFERTAEEYTYTSAGDIIRNTLRLSPGDADAVFDALYMLNGGQESPRERRAADVVDTLFAPDPTRFFAADSEQLVRRFTELQSIRYIAALWKAVELLISNERNFLSATVITDLRPAFLEAIVDGPAAYVLMHELQLKYRDDAEAERQFVLKLDERDIADLVASLDRAKQKSEVLKQFLRKQKLPYLVQSRD
jgi:hypothetical protein